MLSAQVQPAHNNSDRIAIGSKAGRAINMIGVATRATCAAETAVTGATATAAIGEVATITAATGEIAVTTTVIIMAGAIAIAVVRSFGITIGEFVSAAKP